MFIEAQRFKKSGQGENETWKEEEGEPLDKYVHPHLEQCLTELLKVNNIIYKLATIKHIILMPQLLY